MKIRIDRLTLLKAHLEDSCFRGMMVDDQAGGQTGNVTCSDRGSQVLDSPPWPIHTKARGGCVRAWFLPAYSRHVCEPRRAEQPRVFYGVVGISDWKILICLWADGYIISRGVFVEFVRTNSGWKWDFRKEEFFPFEIICENNCSRNYCFDLKKKNV